MTLAGGVQAHRMVYRFEPQESVPGGIKRIADEQIESAIYSLTRSIKANRGRAIHSARKHFKQLRGLVRLIRDDVGQEAYKQENATFRDAGRALSNVRDAEVRIETLDDLINHYGASLDIGQFDGIREALVDAYDAERKDKGVGKQEIAAIVADLKKAQTRIQTLGILDDWQALEGGLHHVYQRGYQGFFRVCKQPTPEHFHDWRKRVKYLWYHLCILSPIWPKTLKTIQKQAKQLSDLLGDDHDLFVLRSFITENLERFEDDDHLQVLLALIQQRQLELQTRARFLGQRLYAETPKAFRKRMAVYWQAWRSEIATSPVEVTQPSGHSAFDEVTV